MLNPKTCFNQAFVDRGLNWFDIFVLCTLSLLHYITTDDGFLCRFPCSFFFEGLLFGLFLFQLLIWFTPFILNCQRQVSSEICFERGWKMCTSLKGEVWSGLEVKYKFRRRSRERRKFVHKLALLTKVEWSSTAVYSSFNQLPNREQHHWQHFEISHCTINLLNHRPSR